MALAAAVRASDGFDPKVAAFAITYHGERSPYRDAAVVVMPGDVVMFNAVGGPPGDYAGETEAGALEQHSARQWRWTAPDRPGTYLIRFSGPGKTGSIDAHAFVMLPASNVRHGVLNGYRIGDYPAASQKENAKYLPPPGFIEVTKENQDTRISPHFTLKQFLCKEDTSRAYPKYVLFMERLPLKLEAILARVNARPVSSSRHRDPEPLAALAKCYIRNLEVLSELGQRLRPRELV